MSNNKLLKVMDYLINEQEDKARELLHQLFIEKARAIHEELMSEDDMEEETIGGHKGHSLGDEIQHNMDEVEEEEHNGDGTMNMEDVDLHDAVDDLSGDLGDDDDMVGVSDDDDDEEADDDEEEADDDEEEADDEEEEADDEEADADMEHEDESQEKRISDLEQEIDELKAMYADIRDGGDVDHHDEEKGKEEEGEVDEGWLDEDDEDLDDEDLDEEWNDLEESLDLETITVNAKKAAEVGSGKFARPEANTKSAVASNAANMNGAKPVVTKSKNHSGYGMESAPTSGDMKLGDNRRKKGDMTTVSKEGSTKALINKDRSEGFGAPNQKSPIGSGTTPKK